MNPTPIVSVTTPDPVRNRARRRSPLSPPSRLTLGGGREPSCPAAQAQESEAQATPPSHDWLKTVHRLRQGDARALARLTRLITSLLHRQGAYRIRESWDDICQDVLAALVRAVERDQLRDPRAFVAFAFALTRNQLVDFVMRRQRITSGGRRDESGIRESIDDDQALPVAGATPDLMLELERALSGLSDRGRRVIEEIYLWGHTYQETSDRLGIPLGTVKRLQTSGLRQLRIALGAVG